MPKFDYQGAINEGYSEEDITNFLSQQHPNFDIKNAQEEGYSTKEISDFLYSPKFTKRVGMRQPPGRVGAPSIAKEFEKKEPEESFLEKFGKAASMQAQMTGMKPESIPSAVSGTLSGLSIGASEQLPGLSLKEAEYPEVAEAFKFGASIAPISIINKAFKPLVGLAEKSPIAGKALGALADITGWGLTGASEKILESAFKGEMPSEEDVFTYGASWAALDAILKTAGLSGRFAKWLISKAEETGKPSWKITNEFLNEMKKEGIDFSQEDRVTAKVLSELERDSELLPEGKPGVDLSKRKIQQQIYTKIDENSPSLAKPFMPKEFDAEQAIKNIETSNIDSKIEKISERALTEQELGKNIQTDIESQFEEAEKIYKPLYEEVENEAKNIPHKATKTIDLTKKILDELNSFKTKPEGYKKIIDTLNDVLNDLGYYVKETPKGLKITDAAGKALELKPIVVSFEIPLSNSMELARRLNKIADYDIIGPSVKNKIKPVISTLKKEIKEVLETKNPELSGKFLRAEKSYGETAQKFGTDAITKIRGQEATEKIAENILQPSTLENLRKILTNKQYNQIEREVLENLRDLSFDKARKIHRELSPHLSANANDIAKSIINEKAPHGKISTVRKIQTGLIEDLNKSFETGTRPKKVLDLWKTIEGQKLIKDALKNNPNKNEILNYLSKQSFYDFASSIVDKSGEIDFIKLNEYLKDPAIKENIKFLGGPEALNFLNSLDVLTKKLQKNLKIIKKIPIIPKKEEFIRGKELLKKGAKKTFPLQFKFENFFDKFGVTKPAKELLKTLGIVKFGETTLALMGLNLLYKFVTKPRFRNSYKNLIKNSNKINKYNVEPLKSSNKIKNNQLEPFIFSLEKFAEESQEKE